MNLSVKKENLNKALGFALRATQTKGTLPILSNILFRTKAGRLNILATNLEIAIEIKVGAKIVSPGAIAIPAKPLGELIPTIKSETVNFKTKGETVLVSGGGSIAKINCLPADDFPDIPKIKPEQKIDIAVSDLVGNIEKICFACATDPTRPVLTGVLWSVEKKILSLVATDSFRLVETIIPLIKSYSKFKFIVPVKAFIELTRHIQQDNLPDILKIEVGQNQFQVSTGDIKLFSRLIEGEYPDYKQILPAKEEASIKVNKQELISACRATFALSQSQASNISLEIAPEKNSLIINSSSQQLGSVETKIKGSAKGKKSKLSFNARFLLSGLEVIDGEDIKICFSGKITPVQITSPKAKNYKFIVMPLRAEE